MRPIFFPAAERRTAAAGLSPNQRGAGDRPRKPWPFDRHLPRPRCATMMAPTGRPSQVDCGRWGFRDRPISPRSPWQNPYVERLIGTLRRDCLDHILIFDERHLRRVLTSYSLYYNETRTHLGLSEGRAATTSRPAIWHHHHHTNLVRIASSLCTDMIFGKDLRLYPEVARREVAFGVRRTFDRTCTQAARDADRADQATCGARPEVTLATAEPLKTGVAKALNRDA